jgi:transcriptional regulator with XRE-family HTH domain
MDYKFAKLLRVYSGYSQENLALKMGVARPYLSRCEQSDKPLSFKVMQKLADACNISLESLFLAFTDVPKELNKQEREIYGKLRSILRMRLILKVEEARLLDELQKIA